MAKDTRTRMIETTARLLQHRGYYGTALSDILDASAAPRGSLYFHFPGGKDQLVVEATRATVEATTAALIGAIEAAKTPAAAVRAYTEGAAELMRASNYTFGCPVAPVILDAEGGLKELSELCRTTLQSWTGLLHGAFMRAGIPKKRADALAHLVVSSIEGLLVVARAYRDVTPMLTVAAELERIVAAATPKKPSRKA
ncbi:MAG: TetR/AcrR family transcriptional regulator [Candidatus Eiseniibacteriota bacterium]